MTLLDYIFCFLAGALLANAVPHFVHGISGDRFPTPFANPPGKGTLNVAWSLFNLVLVRSHPEATRLSSHFSEALP